MTPFDSPLGEDPPVAVAIRTAEQAAGTGDYVTVLYVIALVLLAIGGALAYIVVRNRRGK